MSALHQGHPSASYVFTQSLVQRFSQKAYELSLGHIVKDVVKC